MDDELDSIFNSGGKPQAGAGGQQSTQSPLTDLDSIFTPQQPAAQAADPLDEIFNSQMPGTAAPVAAASTPAPVGDPLDEIFAPDQVQLGTQPTDVSGRPGYVQAFTQAFERGVGQVQQMAPAARGMLAEVQGDEEAQAQALSEIQQLESEMPNPVVGSIADIHNADDFFYWMTEKFGEQAPILGTMALTGGSSALVGNLVGRGFLLKQAARQALIRKAGIAGGLAAGGGLETTGIATELAQATGDFHPELAVPFGAAAGALEMWMPVKLLRELPTASILAGFGKAAGREALTEGAQEQLAIAARDLGDPNYQYFSKDMVLRTAESMAAGFVVGGGVGGVAHGLSKATGHKGGDPGSDVPIDPSTIPPVEPEPEPSAPGKSAVSWLREKMFSRSEPAPDMIPFDPKPTEDVIEQAVINQKIKREWKRAGAKQKQAIDAQNFMDDLTPRYAILDSGGQSGNRIYTATGLEQALAERPAEQFQPRIVRVDQTTMQPGGITAELFDLPESQSDRLWFAGKRMFFLPGVSAAEQQQLKTRYDALVAKLESRPWQVATKDTETNQQLAALNAEYEGLVNQGLRVIPSPGANFHYTGVVDGEAVREIPTSKRSTRVGYLNSKGEFTSFEMPFEARRLPEGFVTNSSDAVPVAIDMALMPKDAIEETQSFNEDVSGFKIKPGAKFPKGAITYGIARPRLYERAEAVTRVMRESKYRDVKPTGKVIKPSKGTLEWFHPEALEMVDALDRLLNELQPVLRNIYKRFGIENPPDILLIPDYDGGISSVAMIDHGEILINISSFLRENWHYIHSTSDLRTSLITTLFHELGHMITMRAWTKLPAAVMEQAQIGYQRALLKYRISGATEHIGLPIGTWTSTDRQINYNLTFIEYLAETFRRWAFSDAQVLTDLDKFYKSTGKELQRLKAEAAKTIGAEKAQDLYQSNFSFNQVMEYLESAAQQGLRPVQLMMKGISLDESYTWPVELEAARTFVESELTRFRQLLTEDMKVELSNEVDDAGDFKRFGVMNPNTRTLRIMLGSLALTGDKTQMSRVIAHEAFHGVQDVLTMAEMQVLAEAGRREKMLKPQELAQYVRDINAWCDEQGITDEGERAQWREYVIISEYAAALIESRVNGRQFESIVAKMLDRIIDAVMRIANGIRGLGYIAADDLARAFYRGELTRRYDQDQQMQAVTNLATKPPQSSMLDWLISGYKGVKYRGEPSAVGAKNFPRSPTARDQFTVDNPDVLLGYEQLDTANQNEQGRYAQTVGDEKAKKKRLEIVRPEQASWRDMASQIPEMEGGEVIPVDANLQLEAHESKDPSGQIKHAVYMAKAPDGTLKGWAEITHRPMTGFEVETIFVYPQYYKEQIPAKVYATINERLGTEVQPNGMLTRSGYALTKRMNPLSVQGYFFDELFGMWLSPYKLQNLISYTQALLTAEKRAGRETDWVRSQLAHFKMLRDKFPMKKDDGAKAVSRILEMKNVERERDREDAELVQTYTGQQIGESASPFEELQDRKEAEEIAQAAKRLGLPEDMVAPTQPDVMTARNVLHGVLKKDDPDVNHYLTGIGSEMDRMSWFSKIFFGLHQVAWRNEHLPWMRQLLALAEQMNTRIMGWISRADGVARAWDNLSEVQRNALSEYMFWLTEMEYRTPQEVAQGVVRHPTDAERQQYITLRRLAPNTVAVGDRVEAEFADYLADVERISVRNAARTFPAGSQQLQAELNKIAADMAALRAKPYFPMTRFGSFQVTVRDPSNRHVEAFYTFPTIRERDAAIPHIAQQWAGMNLSRGVVPEEVQEFMGLPAPLLRMIKAQLPGMTPAQNQWFDQLGALMAPERSFRKRWLARKGTPGYSLDGIRVFSAYFRSGARYLGRLEYKDDMQDQINELRASSQFLQTSTKRMMIADYAQRWINYVMEGGRDWSKFKSVISIFQLGGSVAAAGMNLTQVPLATYPYLAGLFGDVATLKALRRNADILRPTFGLPARGHQDYLDAREEAVAQGKIEAGQAIDLGAFAEYDNLNRTFAGTAAQRAWRQIGYWSMIMFSRSEQFNREWCFKTAYELALANKTSRHFQDTATTYAAEILDVAARRSLTADQATAFMVARRAIDQTQLVFQPWARPTFLRGGFASTLQVFFSYTQGMLYLLGNSPGAKRMWFGLLAMYGLAGLPGSEDLDRLIRLLARKFMGKDFSPQLEARKMIREMTRGTVFDQVGPDLAMHGISRYSLLGIGMLPEGWGVPRFDASASGSMGQVIPGFSELMRGLGNNSQWKDITADVARDISGAGFGQMFALMQFATSDPMSADLKKWEKVFPRAVKAGSKAYRYASDGREETNQGGTLAKFDMRDPDDVATVVAQALGFTPAKVSEKWAAIRATQDIALWYETRKATLYAQLDVAIRNHQAEDQKTVVERMVSLNKELAKQGWGAMGIQVGPVVSSLKQKARVRALQEGDLPTKASQIPLTKEMLDLYPGIEFERMKVR